MELNEKIVKLVESEKYSQLSESEASMMKMMLVNAHDENAKTLAEGTVASDVATFTPIIMPLVRRVYPNLIANELLGVQPMALPTGFIYALTNRYLGNSIEKLTPTSKGQILEMADVTGIVESTIITDSTLATTGDVVYVEANDVADLTKGGKVLVSVSGANLIPGAANGTVINAVYTNELAFGQILKNYTGPMSTAEAEVLGEKMNEIGFDISRKSVEAKSRALKGRYSVEMYQDLKSQHGLSADEELMSLISYEMQAELDREIVSFVNTNATQVANAFKPFDADGRWEIEKYRTEVIKMKKEAVKIGLDTKRGQGNTLVISPSVATMLEEVGGFTTAAQDSGVKQPVSGGVAGTFDNKFKVIVDQFATNNYATVMYKGADRRDSMGFFAPYVPLSFTKVTNFETGQPAIIAKTRYALETIPGVSSPISNDRAKAYARSFGIDFAGTALAD
jgi:hypothetical protein